MADLDLTKGRPEPSGPRASGPRPGTATGEQARQRAETALKGELEGVFGRIGDLLEERGDDELATAFQEDKGVLSKGLLTATETLTPLRKPLVLAVHLVEPILAFGRIAAILVRRVRERFIYEEPEGGTPPV